jgi:hypothetical protein
MFPLKLVNIRFRTYKNVSNTFGAIRTGTAVNFRSNLNGPFG